MADRVKYFLLGLLFLVVAGVIAFDRWNSRDAMGPADKSSQAEESESEIWFDPPSREVEETEEEEEVRPISIIPPAEKEKPHERNYIPEPPKVDPEPEPEPVREEPQTNVHVVRSGETLGGIASRYYPGRVQAGIKLIVQANNISNPNRIRENDRLVIPASKVRAPERSPVVDRTTPVKKTTTNRGTPSTYVVKKGDGDLYRILRKFYGRSGEGARVVRVMEMNDLISPRVKPGTRLKLPPR
ncbi:MAG: LysM peptidoglycan-binding domain-containing protein [Planctomycetota bacterium]|jgi:LysM repeat protein